MTYGKIIELLEEIKEQNDLTENQIKAIDLAIKVLSISDKFCLIN